MSKALSRRMFGRIAAGAPIAAGALSTDLARSIPSTRSYGGLAYKGMPDAVPASTGDYWREERDRLTKLARGEFDEHELRNLTDIDFHARMGAHYDGLRSMSPVARRIAFETAIIERRKAERISWAAFELKGLLKRMGL